MPYQGLKSLICPSINPLLEKKIDEILPFRSVLVKFKQPFWRFEPGLLMPFALMITAKLSAPFWCNRVCIKRIYNSIALHIFFIYKYTLKIRKKGIVCGQEISQAFLIEKGYFIYNSLFYVLILFRQFLSLQINDSL